MLSGVKSIVDHTLYGAAIGGIVFMGGTYVKSPSYLNLFTACLPKFSEDGGLFSLKANCPEKAMAPIYNFYVGVVMGGTIGLVVGIAREIFKN